MSTETETSAETSPEDRFFGITTNPLDSEPVEEAKAPEIEVIDDRPPEDRRPPKVEVIEAKPEEEEGDAELEGYSEKVKKRIDRLTYEKHEERRAREAAERMNEEAVRVTQQYAQQNQQYQNIIHHGEARLVDQFKGRAALAVDSARTKYAKAHEEGDTEAVIRAQEAQIAAYAEWREAQNYEMDYQQRSTNFSAEQAQHQQQQQAYFIQQRQLAAHQQQQNQIPKPSQQSTDWAQNNPWFGNEDHKDMTALAYGVHEKLVRNDGMAPDSPEYFEAIDNEMHTRFPEYFDSGGETLPHKRPTSVVAPAMRNNGARPRKVKLTATQVALAKKLGITVEQYATQLTKGM